MNVNDLLAVIMMCDKMNLVKEKEKAVRVLNRFLNKVGKQLKQDEVINGEAEEI